MERMFCCDQIPSVHCVSRAVDTEHRKRLADARKKTLPSLLNNPRATQVSHPGLLISLPAGDSGIMTDGHLPLLSAQASACSGGAAK